MKVINTYIVVEKGKVLPLYVCENKGLGGYSYFFAHFHMSGDVMGGLLKISEEEAQKLINKTR